MNEVIYEILLNYWMSQVSRCVGILSDDSLCLLSRLLDLIVDLKLAESLKQPPLLF